MWLVNDDGFFSTVQDQGDAGWVYVRGRSETDMEAFVTVARQATSSDTWEGEVVHTPHRDYAFRVHTPRDVWADYLAAKTNDLGYGNFKNHCKDQWTAENRDFTDERLDLLLDAWMLFNHWPDNRLSVTGPVSMAKKKHPPVSEEEARRGIYIDFEGTMEDPASFLGVFLVDDGAVPEFDQPVFEEALWPVARHHKPGKKHGYAAREADFKETFDALRERADSESRKVFAYSTREIAEIRKRVLPRREVQWWEDHLINALPYAKAWKRAHHDKVEFKKGPPGQSAKHTLDQFLNLISYEVPLPLQSGNSAQRIRYVRNMLNKHGGNYGALTPTAKAKWTKACLHNWHDCEGLRKLMIRCAREIP